MKRRNLPFYPSRQNDRSCGKNRYPSKKEAEAIAEEQEIIFANQDLELKVYLCANCGGWHLTRKKIDEHHI